MLNRFLSAVVFLLPVLYTQSSQAQDFRIYETLNAGPATAYVGLRYSAKEYGVGLVDDKAFMKWEVPIPGYVLGLGKLKNDVLVFYTPETSKNGMSPEIKSVRVARVSGSQKRILSDVEVYSKPDNLLFIPLVENDPAGNFAALVIHSTPAKGGGMFSYGSALVKQFETTGMTAIYLNDALQPHSKELKTATIDNGFVTSCADSQHNLYITSVSEGQLLVEKFDANGNLTDKLSTPAGPRNKLHVHGVCDYDSVSGNAINLLMDYENSDKDYQASLYHFDFSGKKVIGTPAQVLNKEYGRALNGGSKMTNLKSIEALKGLQIFETADQLIILREIQYIYRANPMDRDSAPRFTRDATVVSVYTRDLKLVRESVIDKTTESFLSVGDGTTGFLRNGKLYVVTVEGDGIAKYKDVLYTFDTQAGTQTGKTMSRGSAERSLYLEPQRVLWFRDRLVTPLEYGKAFFSVKFTTTLQSQQYE